MQYVMALDQGTTSSRCLLFDELGHIKTMVQREFAQHYPQPGWVEHDPLELWGSQLSVAMEALAMAGLSGTSIAAIGITNQRETALLWDAKTGVPVCPAIVWQCRRTAAQCQALQDKEAWITDKTGLVLDPYFSATKLAWMLDTVPEARERAERGELRFGTVDSWLLWQLTEGAVHATDYTNASRTMLFNIHTMCWDDDLLQLFRIPRTLLPEVRPSSGVFGYTALFGGRVPIAGMAGDQQAALFGQHCDTSGLAKNTYGTGCFLLMNTGATPVRSRKGLLTTIAATKDGSVQYALEGSIFVGGSVVQWLRDEMKLLETAAQSEELARAVEDTAGVYIVPAFVGLGAPYWNAAARGAIVGLTRGSGRLHIVRAALESMAYQTLDVLTTMKAEAGMQLAALRVDGGASSNDFLMQFQSDILNLPVCRPRITESTALGAAALAAHAVQFTDLRMAGETCTFTPNMEQGRRDTLVKGWHKAVQTTLS